MTLPVFSLFAFWTTKATNINNAMFVIGILVVVVVIVLDIVTGVCHNNGVFVVCG